MLPRKKLIALRQEFPRIREEGKLYDSPSFRLVVVYGRGSGASAAFVISKKISLKSVVRHQVKRKLSDALSPLLNRLGSAVELLFLAKPKAIQTQTGDLQKEIETALQRAKLL
ncbi:MAG: ribonuclease P protein component [Patescibacteria group bacterium]|nr:ribonuclease P protein component [Patescibacteria group bacterium]MCL5431656.1 ribonuclease P protein component [Patescibacteria group bacterium]